MSVCQLKQRERFFIITFYSSRSLCNNTTSGCLWLLLFFSIVKLDNMVFLKEGLVFTYRQLNINKITIVNQKDISIMR